MAGCDHAAIIRGDWRLCCVVVLAGQLLSVRCLPAVWAQMGLRIVELSGVQHVDAAWCLATRILLDAAAVAPAMPAAAAAVAAGHDDLAPSWKTKPLAIPSCQHHHH